MYWNYLVPGQEQDRRSYPTPFLRCFPSPINDATHICIQFVCCAYPVAQNLFHRNTKVFIKDSLLFPPQALDPTAGARGDWKSLRLETANTDEYHEVLGRRIHHRLESQRHRIPAVRRVLNASFTMAKIGIFGHLGVYLVFLASSVTCLHSFPVFGLTLVLVFLLCGATFGKRDGFGIAIGVYHLMILLESLVRWRIGVRFEELVSSYGTVSTYLIGVAACGLMESFVAVCFGMSLGLGMASVFCLSRPEETDYFQDGNPLVRPDLLLFVVGCLFGTGFGRHRHTRLVIPVVLGLFILLLPAVLSFMFVCGTSIGGFHSLFLSIGRSLFLRSTALSRE